MHQAVPATKNQQRATRPKRGAPYGNLNALKTGASSRQLRALMWKLLADPEMMRLIAAFARRPESYDRSLQQAIRRRAAQLRRDQERARRRRYEWPHTDTPPRSGEGPGEGL